MLLEKSRDSEIEYARYADHEILQQNLQQEKLKQHPVSKERTEGMQKIMTKHKSTKKQTDVQ